MADDLKHKVKKLGADLRHNLNNPLQEITAMVSVVQLNEKQSSHQGQFLCNIQQAAESMARVIEGLEDRLMLIVSNEDDTATKKTEND